MQDVDKHYQKGHLDRAAKLCESVLAIEPEYEPAHLIRFRCLFDSWPSDQMMTETARVVEMFPNSAEAWMYRGVSYAKTQNIDDAQAAYRRSLELDPDNSRSLHNLGSILVTYGDRTEGIAMLEKAVVLEPDYEIGHGTLAQIYYSEGRFEDAIREAEQAGELIHGYQELRIAYGDSLYQSGRYDLARSIFSRLVEETLLSSPMYAMLCPLVREQDKYDHTGGAEGQDPDRLAATYYRAFLSLDQDEDKQPISVVDLNTVLAGNPDHVYALSGFASLYKLNKDIASATPYIERAIAADPQNPVFIRQKAFILIDEDPSASLSLFEDLLAANPEDIDSGLGKAWALKGLGRDEESVTLLHELSGRNPAFIHGLMGMPVANTPRSPIQGKRQSSRTH